MENIKSETLENTKKLLTERDLVPMYSLWRSTSTNRVYILIRKWFRMEADYEVTEADLLDVVRERPKLIAWKEFINDINRGELTRIIQKS